MTAFLSKTRVLPGLLALGVLVWPAASQACNIPVFRYALERWSPDPYSLTVYHRGPLSPAAQAEITHLRRYLGDEKCPVNATLEQVDLGRLLKVLGASASLDKPWMVLRYPENAGLPTPVYHGPLDGAMIKRLFDSPARQTIANRLLQGESVVWVFLDCGDKDKDEAAHNLLRSNLDKLQKSLKLPILTDQPKDKLLADQLELKIAFSILRLKADDPDEVVLRRMLLNSEEGFADRNDPMVYPLFGRGIALYTLAGKGINENTIASAASFLTDKCSCEAKRLNPGVDLLMTVAWEDRLGGIHFQTPELPLLTGLLKAGGESSGTEPDTATMVPPKAENSAPAIQAWHYLVGALFVVCAGLGVATWFILRKT